MTTLIAKTLLGLALGLGMFSPPVEAPLNPPECTAKPKPQLFCCTKTWSKDGEYMGQDCDLIGDADAGVCRLAGGKLLNCPGAYRDGDNGETICK